MIIGVGMDLQALASLEAKLAGPRFVQKVFTPNEIALCQGQARSSEHFAGKFAIKEAYMKAIGAGIRQGVWFTQIEVLNRPSGAPYIITTGRADELSKSLGVLTVHLSLSHSAGMAVGLVILER